MEAYITEILRSAVDHAPAAHAVSLLAAQPLLDGLLGEEEEELRLPQPLLDQISAKTGEEASVESLTGVSQPKGRPPEPIPPSTTIF